jgi:lipopolysaccharide/colanic/teichoic acid biosynthesis glycosyltransferase
MFLKRLFDIVFSAVLILLLSPVIIVLGLLVVWADGFPALFIQQRVGRYGKPFRMYKFRSMRTQKGTEKGSFDAGDNSRVTPIGRFMRKTKLDELPQLFNVLKGDMSVVGPRPEVQKWVDVYPQRWQNVLSVRPGITDNASIQFRNEEEILAQSSNPQLTYQNDILPQKLSLYEQYVRNAGLGTDIKIIVKTLVAVLSK